MKSSSCYCLFTLIIITSGFLLNPLCFASYSGGTGEPNNPYQISTVADWQQLTATGTDWNKYFIMTADVNLAGVRLTSVGTDGTPFAGVFDGGGRVIRNAVIKDLPYGYCVGLFGYIGSTGHIKNVGVVDANITGWEFVGGIAGYNNGGNVTSCYFTGSVTSTIDCVGGIIGYSRGGNVTGCYSTGSASGHGKYIGGLIGANDSGNVTLCYSTNSVSGDSDTGGFIGGNSGSITSSYATGLVTGSDSVGGLVGSNWGNVIDCYAAGQVTGTYFVGGLVGYNWQAKVVRCYSTGKPTGIETVGGLCGGIGTGGNYEDTGNFWDMQTSQIATSAMGTGKTTAEMKILSTFTSMGWNFVEIWNIGENQTYPYLRTEPAGDLNRDKKVDFDDFAILAQHWLEGTEP